MDITKFIPHPKEGFWRSFFFYLMAISLLGVLIWQLWELEPPTKFCPVNNLQICYEGIVTVLHIKDHAIIGLLAVTGLVVVGSMVVTYSLSVRAGGSVDGGFNVDVHQDKTTITTPSGTVNVPTIPNPDTITGGAGNQQN